MKSSIPESKIQQAMAQLALKARNTEHEPAVGPAPETEELCALADGKLDDTRRAQVLTYIASDEAVYLNWLQVLESNASALSSAAEPGKASAEATSDSLLGRLANLFSPKGLAGLGTGMAAVFAFTVLVQSPQLLGPAAPGLAATGVQQIYTDYGTSWSRSPQSLAEVRSRGNNGLRSASAEQQALFAGAQEGMSELGKDFSTSWLPALKFDPDAVAQLAPDLYSSLHASGKLTAISHFKCQLDGEAAFYQQSNLMLEQLQSSLAAQDSELALTLADSLVLQGGQALDPQDKVCRFARQVVTQLHIK